MITLKGDKLKNNKTKIVVSGVNIEVYPDGKNFSVRFSPSSKSKENLQGVQDLKGFITIEKALVAGKNFVGERQWRHQTPSKGFKISLRKLFNNSWGYKIEDIKSFNALVASNYNYSTEAAALQAAVTYLESDLT